MDGLTAAFLRRGWRRFPVEPAVADWAAHVAPLAASLAADPGLRARWLRCGGTWFAGVGVLPNAGDGSVPMAGAGPLAGAAVAFIARALGFPAPAWEAAQVSVTWPGYPRPGAQESAAAARFRRQRDAAHVDGLLPRGPARRRIPGEQHAFLLGLPLTAAGPGAAPFVVWDGSHAVIRAALAEALAPHPPAHWAETDVTDAYHAARARVFATCPRVELPARPGEALLVHRLALHGTAPWAQDAPGPPGGRAIAWFRPACGITPEAWLTAP